MIELTLKLIMNTGSLIKTTGVVNSLIFSPII